MTDAVVLSAVRTPIGRFLGGLASLEAPALGAKASAEAIRRAGVAPDQQVAGASPPAPRRSPTGAAPRQESRSPPPMGSSWVL